MQTETRICSRGPCATSQPAGGGHTERERRSAVSNDCNLGCCNYWTHFHPLFAFKRHISTPSPTGVPQNMAEVADMKRGEERSLSFFFFCKRERWKTFERSRCLRDSGESLYKPTRSCRKRRTRRVPWMLMVPYWFRQGVYVSWRVIWPRNQGQLPTPNNVGRLLFSQWREMGSFTDTSLSFGFLLLLLQVADKHIHVPSTVVIQWF